MPSKQTRQNTLLVPPILRTEKEACVDLHYQFSIKGIEKQLAVLMNLRRYEPHLWKEEYGERYWVLFSKLLQIIDLGMSEELNSTDSLRHKVFQRNLKINAYTDPPLQFFFSKRFDLTAHAYYGLRSTYQFPKMILGRRRQRHHPSRHIGVGYKDKGAARSSTWDGTPSWQKVSSVSAYEERSVTELSSSLHISEKPVIVKLCNDDRWTADKYILLNPMETSLGALIGYKVQKVGTSVLSFLPVSDPDDISPQMRQQICRDLGSMITDGINFLCQRSLVNHKAQR